MLLNWNGFRESKMFRQIVSVRFLILMIGQYRKRFLICVIKKWGPITIDRFPDNKDKKLEKFNSRFWVPGTDGVDAFALNWHHENNWCVFLRYI